MLKCRLIPILNIMNGLIVRSESFTIHQNIGNIINEASRYNEWNVDELVYLDISRTQNYDLRRDDHKIASYSSIEEIITRISKVCFMPLTFGGGIRTLADVDLRVRHGADKVSVNTAAFTTPDLISQIAQKYGSQCIIVSIDYKIINGEPIVFSHYGTTNTKINLYDWLKENEQRGAGEILLNSIDRDGAGDGFDIEIIGKAVQQLKIPLIACGGAGDFYDFVDLAKETNVSGIAAGNTFHFTERAYPRAKKLMKEESINVR